MMEAAWSSMREDTGPSEGSQIVTDHPIIQPPSLTSYGFIFCLFYTFSIQPPSIYSFWSFIFCLLVIRDKAITMKWILWESTMWWFIDLSLREQFWLRWIIFPGIYVIILICSGRNKRFCLRVKETFYRVYVTWWVWAGVLVSWFYLVLMGIGLTDVPSCK